MDANPIGALAQLGGRSHTTQRTPAGEALSVSIKEAAQITRLCERTIYNLMSAGSLPWVKIGARRLVLVDDLRALLAAHRSEPVTAQ